MTKTSVTISSEVAGITISVSAYISSGSEVFLIPVPEETGAAAVHPECLPLLAAEIASLLPQVEAAVLKCQNQSLDILIHKEKDHEIKEVQAEVLAELQQLRAAVALTNELLASSLRR